MKPFFFRGSVRPLLIAACAVLIPVTAQAYIGPGAGFVVAGSFLVICITILSAFFVLLTWPLRFLVRFFRYRKVRQRSRFKRVVILGLDGLDYALAQKYLASGKLPNFARLRNQGCFKHLSTTLPAISPVAWSSFQTGVNPGKHNIFDFLTRDRRTYAARLSSTEIRGANRTMTLGKYRIPLGSADLRLLRKAIPFWKILGDHGVFSSIIRVPISFPVEKFRGVQLSAMCTPDIRGTQGMFSYYTTAAPEDQENTGGECYRVERRVDQVQAALMGPDDPMLKKATPLTCPFTVTLNGSESAALKIGKNVYTLKKGVYSDWVRVTFRASLGVKVQGICKFLLIDSKPEFRLYVTPVNLDPEKPAMPISFPKVYATYLAKQQGPYATLGLAEDSWALNEKLISDEAFFEQCLETDQERERMFFDSLDKVRKGLTVCVFDGTDRVQHAFWRQMDVKHPAHERPSLKDGTVVIEEIYKRADDLVGRTLDQCNPADTLLMIISDHGFNAFRYGVDLNRWLEENGYLYLKEEGRHKKNLAGVDWSRSRAFAIGLAGIFLNLKGREAQGIVDPQTEAPPLRREIARKLQGLNDDRHNQPVIKNVYNAWQVYRGPYKKDAPDLLVGYQAGYRASWETAVGQVTAKVLHDNTKAWSGDHGIDPSLVPGVLFCNQPIHDKRPRLMDIGPTVLGMFGIQAPAHMDGRALKVGLRPAKGGSGPS
ncbi:MAG: nucleotide pyrophosphatase [Deltaproteobacteria bacterium]|nr:nucleotide pyrophosphatase [Deltaproteobacteria bacterium]